MWRKFLVALFVFVNAYWMTAIAADEEKPTFSMTTNAFLDKMSLPVLYTCDGKNESPQLEWTNVPAKTKTLALIMTDPDAPTQPFYHWIVFNIPTSAKKFDQGMTKMPSGAIVGKNNMGHEKYDGPCPPKGATHNYILTLYALDSSLPLKSGADGKTVLDAMKNHIVEKTELTTTYARWLR